MPLRWRRRSKSRSSRFWWAREGGFHFPLGPIFLATPLGGRWKYRSIRGCSRTFPRPPGENYQATDRESLRQGLRKVLDALERSKLMEGGAAAHYQERYHPFLLWAFALAGAELVLRSSWLRVAP